MKRVTNTNKSMTSEATANNPSVPSMGGQDVKVNFKAVPVLSNFLRGHATTELENRKAGKFKLKQFKFNGNPPNTYIILTYQLNRTKYIIESCTKITYPKSPIKIVEGYVRISKGLFKSKKFKLNELPVNVVASINKNIEAFNTLYESQLRDSIIKVQSKKEKKQTNFFSGLDT